MINAKRILITGASGFIGGFLIDRALMAGYEIYAGVRKSSSIEYLQDERIHFIDLDYENKKNLIIQLKEVGKFDYIIHNAGVTKCLRSDDFYKINYQYTANFIDALGESGNSPDKFILMSSLSVFGMGDEKYYRPILLSDHPNPNTAYGKSKLKAEEYLQKTAKFPYVIFRPTGVYGAREKDYYLMLKTVKSGFDVGAGFKPQHLTFIYVKDLAEAVFLSLENGISNKAYFVTDGNVYTDREYTRLIKQILGLKFVLRIKIPLFLLKFISSIAEDFSRMRGRPSTLNRDKFKIMKQRNWECDIEPLVRDLGFSPQYNLERGLQESISWYKENGWL